MGGQVTALADVHAPCLLLPLLCTELLGASVQNRCLARMARLLCIWVPGAAFWGLWPGAPIIGSCCTDGCHGRVVQRVLCCAVTSHSNHLICSRRKE